MSEQEQAEAQEAPQPRYLAACTIKTPAARFVKAGYEVPVSQYSEEQLAEAISRGLIYPEGGAPVPQSRRELPVGNADKDDHPDVVLSGGDTFKVDGDLEDIARQQAAQRQAGQSVTPAPGETAPPQFETVTEREPEASPEAEIVDASPSPDAEAAQRAETRAAEADVSVDLETGTVEGDEDGEDEDDESSLFEDDETA